MSSIIYFFALKYKKSNMKIIFKVLKALFFGFGGALVGIILAGIFTAGVGAPIFGMLGATLGL